MSEFKEVIYDASTGETSERNYTAAEIAEVQAKQAEMDAQEAAYDAQQEAKQAVLDKLGLSVEEVAALLG
jgi:hypothetical protein